MSKEKNIIHTQSECLSEKTLFDYIDDKLSQKERHVVEKHLLDCEMCSDALEGLEMVKDRGRITFIKNEINKRILIGAKPEAKVVPFNYKMVFSVAATIALLVVGIFLFKQMSLKKEMDGGLAEFKETENSSPSMVPPPPPPPLDASGEESESGVTENLQREDNIAGLKKEGAKSGPGNGLLDEEAPVTEQQSSNSFYKTEVVVAEESKNEVAMDEKTAPATTSAPDAAANDEFRKKDKLENAPAAPKASQPDMDREIVTETKKSEEKAGDHNNNQQTTDQKTSTGNTTANNSTTTKTTGNGESAKEIDKGKNKNGVARSEAKPAEVSGKAKKNAGKETGKDDQDLAFGGAVGYEPDGIVKEKEKANGEQEEVVTLSTAAVIKADSSIAAVTVAEVMPQYPGGDAAMMKFITTNFKFTGPKDNNNNQSLTPTKIYLQFIIDTDGSIRQPKIIKGIDPAIDKEALRVIKLMPKWIPGKQNGQPVPVLLKLPIQLEVK